MRSFFLGTMDETLVLSFNKAEPFTYSRILSQVNKIRHMYRNVQ